MEVNAEEIRRMGQWSNTVYDNSYSSKLLMNVMRNLAGYNSANGLYFNNTRMTVMPSQELCEQTPLGSFALGMLKQLVESDHDGKHQTAYETLRWFCDLSIVFLQVAAAMMLQCPERASHPLFQMECFHTDAYKVCCD
jgi:hypothetical protein